MFDLTSSLLSTKTDRLIFLLDAAIMYLRKLRIKEKVTQELLALQKEQELAILKSQINPHFLFNTLNSISAMASTDTEETRTMIFYESPYRLVKALDEMSSVFGSDREACVSRELTKIFEENRRGTIGEIAEFYRQNPPRGETVIIVAGK